MQHALNIKQKNAKHLLLYLCIITLLCLSTYNSAQAQPQRHYEMIIPIAAGGSMDLISRAVAQALSEEIKEPVTPINKVGAGTVIGIRDVANDSNTDGRKLLISGVGYTSLQFKQGGSPFDTKKLKPVIYIGWQPTVLFARSTIRANNYQEFLKWAKSTPNGVTFASSGIGSSPHIGAEQFSEMTGIKMTHVPMGGSSQFRNAVAGGHVDAVFDAPATRELVQSGQLKAFFVGLDHHLQDWPDLPASTDVGLPGFMAGTWYGVFVSAGTPDKTIAILNEKLNVALKMPLVQQRSQQFGISIVGGTPQEFKAFLDADHERISNLVKSRGLIIP